MCIHLRSQYRWLRSGRGWGCIRPPAPHSNFQYIPPGSGSSEHFLRLDTDPSYDTDGQHRFLWGQDETVSFTSTPIHTQQTDTQEHGGIFKTPIVPLCLAATSQETLGTSQ